MNTTQLWNKLNRLFDNFEDGLPEICLTNLSGTQIEDIFLFLWSQGSDVTAHGGGTFWDIRLEQSRMIDSVENAAALVVQGFAEPIHVVIGNLQFLGAIIPDLGAFIFDDSVVLDYRSGSEWGHAELGALFECLYQIKRLAPDVKVALDEVFFESERILFQQMLEQYIQDRNDINSGTPQLE